MVLNIIWGIVDICNDIVVQTTIANVADFIVLQIVQGSTDHILVATGEGVAINPQLLDLENINSVSFSPFGIFFLPWMAWEESDKLVSFAIL